MSKTYTKPDGKDVQLCQQAAGLWHPDLGEAGVAVGLIMVDPSRDPKTGEPVSPAITEGKEPCAARIGLTNAKQRVYVPYDAIMEIDLELWSQMDDAHKLALMDHELRHLVIERENDGGVILTADLRPKLSVARHDWHLSGFHDVVQRHGAVAIEAMNLVAAVNGPLKDFAAGDPQQVFAFEKGRSEKVPA